MRGRGVYEKMQCGKCHGPDGKGDDPSAKTLKGNKGRRIYPFDFT
jgi:mono/diheme cytochrome c family protein